MSGLYFGNGWHTMSIQFYFPWNNTPSDQFMRMPRSRVLKCGLSPVSIPYNRFIHSMNISCVTGETGSWTVNCHSLWLNVASETEYSGSTKKALLTLWEQRAFQAEVERGLRLVGWGKSRRPVWPCQPSPSAFLLLRNWLSQQWDEAL